MRFTRTHIIPEYSFENIREERDKKIRKRQKEIDAYYRDRKRRHVHRLYSEMITDDIKTRWKNTNKWLKILFVMIIVAIGLVIIVIAIKKMKKNGKYRAANS